MKSLMMMRAVSLTEGISWLVLLFIAMPLKYMADYPLAVTLAGMAHGALFMALMSATAWVWIRKEASFGFASAVMLASLVPFGAFVIDRRIKAHCRLRAATQSI